MKILMVCLGNICRSPLAEGILIKKAKEKNISITVDSAGLEPYHIGHSPDSRTLQIAKMNRINISDHKMRMFSQSDFDEYDKIYVMDQSNLRDILFMARSDEDKKKVAKIRSVLSGIKNLNVPDPYYGKIDEFEEVYNLLNEACDKIVENLS